MTGATGDEWYVTNKGVPGATVASMATGIDALLATVSPGAAGVLINLGVNEMSALPAEATWRADYQTIIDAAHTKWPTATIWLARPWMRGYDAESDTLAGWIATLQAANAGYVSVGTDERVWMEGGDNGVTMTTDGVHYSAAGQTECAVQWRTSLGY